MRLRSNKPERAQQARPPFEPIEAWPETAAPSGSLAALVVPEPTVERSPRRALALGGSVVLLAGLLLGVVAFGRFDDGPAPVITGIDAGADVVASGPVDGVEGDIPFGTVIDTRAVVVGPLPELSDGSTGAVREVSAGGVRFIAHRACLQANGFDIDLFEPPPQLPGVAPPLPPPPPADLPWRQLTAEEAPVAQAATKACRDLQPGQSEWRQWLGCLDQQGLTVVALRGTLIPPAVSLDQARSAGTPADRSARPVSCRSIHARNASTSRVLGLSPCPKRPARRRTRPVPTNRCSWVLTCTPCA